MPMFSVPKSPKRGTFGLLFLLAICGVPRASAQSQFFCWVIQSSQSDPYAVAGQPAYFTALIDVPDKDHLARGLFAQYVEKKYSVRHHGYPYCTQLVGSNLQDEIERIKQQGGTAVMTDWTPGKHEALMADAAKNHAPPPPAPAAKRTPPPPLAAQTAYEKAMAAQRPHSVSQAQLAAAKAGAGITPATGQASGLSASTSEKYVFCESTGSPYRGTAQSHYYVTQVFAASAGHSHPQDAFKAYLHGAHPQEDISSSSCSTPGPRSAVESTRRSFMENERKMPNRAIVELAWQPKS